MEINRERFEAWLFSQPRERTFNYMDGNGGCLICHFFQQTTKLAASVGGNYYTVAESLPAAIGRYIYGERETIPFWLYSLLDQRERRGLTQTNSYGHMQDAYVRLYGPVNGSPGPEEPSTTPTAPETTPTEAPASVPGFPPVPDKEEELVPA